MNVQNVLPRDAIPSIDQPTFGPEYFGAADDEMLVIDGDPPRAYPIRILSYHEIVNDVVDDRPIAVTWCPICWSGAVYERRVNGQTLTFGTSGKLADDVLVMYDRETESEWQQSTGTAIAGQLHGERLLLLHGRMLSWEQFNAEYPDGIVLQPRRRSDDTGDHSVRDSYDMEPYNRYKNGDEFGLYGMRGEGPRRSWKREDIAPKTVVVGVEHGGDAVAVPVVSLEASEGLVQTSVGDTDIIVVGTGNGASVFVHPGFEVTRDDDRLCGDGTTWTSSRVSARTVVS